MKSPIDKIRIFLISCSLLCLPVLGYSQTIVAVQAGDQIVETEGTIKTTTAEGNASAAKVEGAVELGVQTVLFAKMENWQRKYNEYLKNADLVGNVVKASFEMYDDAFKTFHELMDILDGMKQNPQGVFATGFIGSFNLYGEVASDFISCFTALKKAVSKGGKDNMLSAADRAQLWWMAQDKLHALRNKLHHLNLSIRYYNMADVWNKAKSLYYHPSKGKLAQQARKRFNRCLDVVKVNEFNKKHSWNSSGRITTKKD